MPSSSSSANILPDKMESEMTVLRRRYFDSLQNSKAMKQLIRLQKDKSRKLIMACSFKLQEKEAEIQQLRSQHEQQLNFLSCELTFLRANMLKEQIRLQNLLAEKSAALEAQMSESDRLRKLNKKLQNVSQCKSKQSSWCCSDTHPDMDTPSSEDSSPQSSFSSKSGKSDNKTVARTKVIHSDSDAACCDSPPPPALLSRQPCCTPPPLPPSCCKPMVPSRAHLDQLLIKAHLHKAPLTSPPPPPPPADPAPELNHHHHHHHRNNVAAVGPSSPSDSGTDHPHHDLTGVVGKLSCYQKSDGDEGFCSSHEDHQQQRHSEPKPSSPSSAYNAYLDSMGLNHKSVAAVSSGNCRMVGSNNHRSVQKPSHIKQRAKLKSSTAISSLAVLEEHQVSHDGQVTTVTYWTEPYL